MAELSITGKAETAMDAGIVSAMAAVLGSLVGGSATLATAWITQNTLRKREVMGAEIRKREMLYAEFIHECSKLITDSYTHTLDKPETLLSSLCPAQELIGRIRLSSSDAILAEAENVLKRIANQYFLPNLSVEETRAVVESDTADPLKSFGEACRAELKSMLAAM